MADKRRTGRVKKLSFGLYGRKLIFFVLIFAALWIFLAYISRNPYSADTSNGPAVTNFNQNMTVNLEIKQDGQIVMDGKDSGKIKSVDDNTDELRLVILDQPKKYLDKVDILVKVPEGSAYKTKHEILAIHGVESSYSQVLDQNTVEYVAQGVSPVATVSIVTQFPKGIISYSIFSDLLNQAKKTGFNFWVILAIALPAITIIYMIMFLLFQYRLQRVEVPPKATSSPPMALPPAIVGVLFHQKVGPREIAATLIDLALRNDIVILDRERGFAFGKGKFDKRLLGYEKMLLAKIFRNNLTSEEEDVEARISSHLYSKKMSIVSAGIYAIATRLGYFRANPRRVHAKYRLIGSLALLAGMAGFILSFWIQIIPSFTSFFWVGMMVSALIIILTASRIPLRTEIGKEALSNWLAFRKFLSDPKPIEYTPTVHQLFEVYLPYAVVLDCEAAWANRFAEHNFSVPNWFITDKEGLGIEDFCLSLFPIVSYVGRSLAALREPGFE